MKSLGNILIFVLILIVIVFLTVVVLGVKTVSYTHLTLPTILRV